MYYTTQGIQPIFHDNCKWSVTFKIVLKTNNKTQTLGIREGIVD